MTFRYYLALDCETCEEQMKISVLDLDADPFEGGDLIVDLDLTVSQTTFKCQHCGGVTFLGELADTAFHEPGQDPVIPDTDEADSDD